MDMWSELITPSPNAAAFAVVKAISSASATTTPDSASSLSRKDFQSKPLNQALYERINAHYQNRWVKH